MKKKYFTLWCILTLAMQAATAQTFTGIDIWPGAGSSYPYGMTEFNGKVYFGAEGDTTTGYELWVSDGTQSGTSMVMDILPGPGNSDPENFYVANGMLFFTADDSVHGEELWVSDGTTAGTHIVKDIWAGPGTGVGNFTPLFAAYGGKLYFSADDSIHGDELWVSDGTNAGTSLVKDIWPGPGSAGLWASSLSSTGTAFTYSLNVFNNKLYFQANDSVHGGELWVSDGTTAGTTMVADIFPGSGSSSPYCITQLGSNIYFSAMGDTVNGYELYTSDGTGAGTQLVKDIYPGGGHLGGEGADVADYSGFLALNNKLYFSANQPATGYEIWSTDGTSAGTTLLKDIWPGSGSSYAAFYGLAALNGSLYFIAQDSIDGTALWSSDGTTAGTSLFKTLGSYPYFSSPYQEHFWNIYNNKLVFIATEDSTNLEQLYSSDGTVAGTVTVQPAISPNLDPLGNSYALTVANGNLFFAADYNGIGNELWVYSTPLGISSISGDNTITAYPNPFGASISVSGLNASRQYTIQIVDMTGRECYSTGINDPSQNTAVSLPDLPAGIYLMRVSGGGQAQTFKLSKN